MNVLRDAMPCGLMRTDLDGRIVAANARLAVALGYPSVDALPDRLDAVLPGAGRLHYQLQLLPTLSVTGRMEEVYLDLVTASGGTTPMLINLQVAAEGGAYDWALMRVAQRAQWEAAMLEARRDAELRTEEAAESAARLARALEELKEHNWLLGKVAEVLPTCMYCGRVKAGESGWEEAIEYLKRNSTFLSHGCCPTCQPRMMGEMGLQDSEA